MTDKEFVERVVNLTDKSELDKETKKIYSFCIAGACYSKKSKSLISDYLKKDGITLESTYKYAMSVCPDGVITQYDEDD